MTRMRFKTNIRNICKLHTFNNKRNLKYMRKLLLLFVLLFSISCEKNETNDILPEFRFMVSLKLNSGKIYRSSSSWWMGIYKWRNTRYYYSKYRYWKPSLQSF